MAQLVANVYRDDHGLPHIEAETEEAAWYAMGFEEARDTLQAVQANLKRVRGEAALYLGRGVKLADGTAGEYANVYNDLVVRLYRVRLTPQLATREQLKEMLAVKGKGCLLYTSPSPRD